MSLEKLVSRYLMTSGFKIIARENNPKKFNYVVQDGNHERFAVVIKDWSRNIGINAIRSFQEKLEAHPELGYGVLFADHFSPQLRQDAEAYYKKIKLMSKHDLLSKMNEF
ncbi:MAG: restriction endonuclease [Candidatus Helarchaeales archaeon]